MNSDYEKRALINTNETVWDKIENNGVLKKTLSKKDDEETSILRLEKGNKLSTQSKINSVEIIVLEGTYTNEHGTFESGSYLQFSKEDESQVSSENGCTIFRKVNYFTPNEDIIIDTNTTAWLQGQGNLEVMPLYEQTALVKWPEGEKFIPHKHWGGEEIFVLKGTFMDEHGSYPKGSWIRSPHLSEHFPYVEEETIIYVKTGHL